MKIKNLILNMSSRTKACICAGVICLSGFGYLRQLGINNELKRENENLKLTVSDLNDDISGLETAYEKLNEQIVSLQSQLDELTKIEETQPKKNKTGILDLGIIDAETARNLFYSDGLLTVDSISNSFPLSGADHNFDPVSGVKGFRVCEIEKDGVKYLVAEEDYTRVLLSDYESVSHMMHLRFYSYRDGGPDSGSSDGWVYEIVKDGVKYLVDANDWTKVLLTDCDIIVYEMRLFGYDFVSGGTDTGEGQGYVSIIEKEGIKYLVDANDFTKILAIDFDHVTSKRVDGELKIVITYHSGKEESYEPSEFKPIESDILVSGYSKTK